MEELLVHCLIRVSDIGLGLTKFEILTIVKEYLIKTEQTHVFPDGCPGPTWYKGFCERWKDQLRPRMAQNLAKNRAQAVTEETAKGFFQIVKKKLVEIELGYGKPLPPTNFWNCDESGYCSSQGDNVILCRKG